MHGVENRRVVGVHPEDQEVAVSVDVTISAGAVRRAYPNDSYRQHH